MQRKMTRLTLGTRCRGWITPLDTKCSDAALASWGEAFASKEPKAAEPKPKDICPKKLRRASWLSVIKVVTGTRSSRVKRAEQSEEVKCYLNRRNRPCRETRMRGGQKSGRRQLNVSAFAFVVLQSYGTESASGDTALSASEQVRLPNSQTQLGGFRLNFGKSS